MQIAGRQRRYGSKAATQTTRKASGNGLLKEEEPEQPQSGAERKRARNAARLEHFFFAFA